MPSDSQPLNPLSSSTEVRRNPRNRALDRYDRNVKRSLHRVEVMQWEGVDGGTRLLTAKVRKEGLGPSQSPGDSMSLSTLSFYCHV